MKKIVLIAVFALVFLIQYRGLGASSNGSAGNMPAYYDGKLFTINFKELPTGGEAATDTHNHSINVIYMADSVPGFVSVLDAIQGDGFNPLWEEVQIAFNPGFVPHQFKSDTEIEAAADAGEITLTETGEIYRCSVVGRKK
jgi:hypothetical protein